MEDHSSYCTSGRNIIIEYFCKTHDMLLLYMEVMKKHVDNHQSGQWIPGCQLSAVFTLAEDKRIPLLQYQVKLIGAKEPFNMMAIELPSVSGTQRYPKHKCGSYDFCLNNIVRSKTTRFW